MNTSRGARIGATAHYTPPTKTTLLTRGSSPHRPHSRRTCAPLISWAAPTRTASCASARKACHSKTSPEGGVGGVTRSVSTPTRRGSWVCVWILATSASPRSPFRSSIRTIVSHAPPCTTRHAPCVMRHAPGDAAPCTMYHAPCAMRRAPCSVCARRRPVNLPRLRSPRSRARLAVPCRALPRLALALLSSQTWTVVACCRSWSC